MEITKKQVAALLKIMSNDTSRAVLTELRIDVDENDKTVVVATDGNVMAVLPTATLDEHRGKSIPREELVKWHKLAGSRSLLSESDLTGMATQSEWTYPDWKEVLSKFDTQAPIAYVSVDAKYLTALSDLAGHHLTFTTYGINRALIAHHDGARYVLMPLKH